jgi:hypothetical protein
MAELPINANISEIDGSYYPVNLQWVPRVGELIDLWSFIDQADKRPPARHYEVVQVVHRIHDVTDKGGREHKGAHFLTVHVKQAQSRIFE